MNVDSYIKLPSNRVIELAQRTINRINSEHEKAWSRAISHFRGGRQGVKALGAFWLTDEKKLSNDDCKYLIRNPHKWHCTWPPVFPQDKYLRCEWLIAAAKETDYVYLSIKDYSIIL